MFESFGLGLLIVPLASRRRHYSDVLDRSSSPFFSANPRSFRIHFLQQSKGAFLPHPRSKREVEAFTGRARLCFVRRRRSDF